MNIKNNLEKNLNCNLIAKKLRGNKSFSYFGKPIDEDEWKDNWKEELKEIVNLEKKLFLFCYENEELYKSFIKRILRDLEELDKKSDFSNSKCIAINWYIQSLKDAMIVDIPYDDRYIYDDKGRKVKYIFRDLE